MTYRGEIKNLREKAEEQRDQNVVDLPVKSRKVRVTHPNWATHYLNGALILSIVLLGYLIYKDVFA